MSIRIDGNNTAANPGITGADADTGLQFGTDEVSIVTGGTDRVKVDSSGSVGIGTSAPARNLHINGADSDTVQVHLTNSTTGVTSNDGFSLALGSDESGILNMREANPMRFFTSDTERLRIDSSGRLLVGTSTPLSVLTSTIDLVGTGASVGQAAISIANFAESANAVARPMLNFYRTRGTQATPTANTSGDLLGQINFNAYDGNSTDNYTAARIECFAAAAHGVADTPGSLVFSTTADGASSPTARMRIDSRGQSLFLSDGTPSVDFMLSTQAGTSGSTKLLSLRRSATAGILGTGSEVCIVRRNGDLDNTNNSYGSISDIKLKENIIDANSQWDDLKALQVRNYNFKVETGNQTHTQLGLIAQEVELVSPGLVKTTPDLDDNDIDLGTTTKSVNYSVLYMKAVKALQEAMERIETLETQNASLEARLTALEGGAE